MRPATRSSSPFSRSPGVIGEMRGAFARADATLAHPSTGARAILNPVENSAMVGALHDMALEAIGMRTSPVRCIAFVALLALAARVESATAANERGPKPAVGLRTTGGVACGSDWWRSAEPGQTEARGLIVCPTGTGPAVLLVHGLHQGKWSWLQPSSHDQYSYDYRHDPQSRKVDELRPAGTPFKIGKSNKLDGEGGRFNVDDHAWFNVLRDHQLTVATWTQPGKDFKTAYASAKIAFTTFLQDTAALNPSSPPPAALLAHSRGGLVVRQLLKDFQSDDRLRRVKWVITLHSPHQGSDLGRYKGKIGAEF